MTQHLTNAPAIVTQLATQLDLCAAWTGDDWYPDVPWASAVLPLAVLEESDRNVTSYAAGASGIAGGSLGITLHFATTVTAGTAESTARTILDQLMTQAAGIVFRRASTGLCGTYTTAEAATDTATTAVRIDLEYGLST